MVHSTANTVQCTSVSIPLNFPAEFFSFSPVLIQYRTASLFYVYQLKVNQPKTLAFRDIILKFVLFYWEFVLFLLNLSRHFLFMFIQSILPFFYRSPLCSLCIMSICVDGSMFNKVCNVYVTWHFCHHQFRYPFRKSVCNENMFCWTWDFRISKKSPKKRKKIVFFSFRWNWISLV